MRNLIVLIVAICLLGGGLFSPNTDLDEPPEFNPHTGGATEYRYGYNCPSPYSIEYSNIIRQWPFKNLTFTQYYNSGHPAVDLSATLGDPIKSVGYGFVTTSEYMAGGYGWHVIVEHPDGWETLYAHMMEEPDVDVGDYVFPGKTLGSAGSTGQSTGVHLHFEILYGGCYLDPKTLIQ